MIARVKIAPVERWCQPCKDGLNHSPQAETAVGLEVGIHPSTMEYDPVCGGRSWFVDVPAGWEGRDCRTGGYVPRARICEHLLEMD